MAVMNVGAPAGGMNPATKAFVRGALTKGHSVLAFRDGFDGLVKGQVQYCKYQFIIQSFNEPAIILQNTCKPL